MEKKKIGVIGVDTGCCWIGDPYYIREPEYLNAFCQNGASEQVCFDKSGLPGKGIVFRTGYGDGLYDVIAYFDKEERITKIEIDFQK